jgi:small-conductance mechanosensitive channel
MLILFMQLGAPLQAIGLDSKLLNTSSEQKTTSVTDPKTLDQARLKLQAKEQAFNEVAKAFDTQLLQLQQQINQTKQNLAITNDSVEEQLRNTRRNLEELKEQSNELATELSILRDREKQIPIEFGILQQKYNNHLNLKFTPKSPNYALLIAERQYLKQAIQTTNAEQDTQNERWHLIMFRQELINDQEQQYKRHIQQLNKKQKEQIDAETDAVIQNTLPDKISIEQAISLTPLIRENQALGIQLKQLNKQINDTILLHEAAEKLYQRQSKQLSNIEEQVNWSKANAAFGESLILQLEQLKNPPDLDKTEQQLATLQVTKYEYENQLSNLEQQLEIDEFNKALLPFLIARRDLLQKINARYRQAILEVSRLKVKYEEIIQLNDSLRDALNQYLFWVRNTTPISTDWFNSLSTSLKWFVSNTHWQELYNLNEQATYWYWWLIWLTFILMLRDLLKKPYLQLLAKQNAYVGHMRKDNIFKTLKVLAASAAYANLLPLVLFGAAYILTNSSNNFIFAIGNGLFTISLLISVYSFFHQISQPHGMLVKHLGYRARFMISAQIIFFKLILFSAPMIALIVFTEYYESSFLRNSLGRAAFICLCLGLSRFYYHLFRLSKRKHLKKFVPKPSNRLYDLGWFLLITLPIGSLALAVSGYYYTALQITSQFQLTIFLAFILSMLYLLIQRWLVLQQRRITFERARQKRSELSKDESTQHGAKEQIREDILAEIDDHTIDIDIISKQSLQFVRILLMVIFVLASAALWTQSQAALLSFLDQIPLWSTHIIVDGIQQTQPVTLKSAILFVIIIGLVTVFVRNLPSVLEFMILQKIKLQPGTSFAITTLTRYLLIIIGLSIGFNYLGIEWSQLQWLVAALTFGLGFGLQEIFGNFISGLIILFEKPIRIGDTVTIRDLTGTISRIHIRATTIIDWDRKEIIIPNKAFVTEQLINWSLSDPITRVISKISVARGSDPTLVETLLHQAVKECKYALEVPEPEIWFIGFGSHTQDYEVRAYANDMNSRWPLRHELHKIIQRRFVENNIVLAYPQLEVYMHNHAESTSTPK